ncbi:meiotic chromosome segregation protein [Phlyctema vagabunda]|uniref:Meiotic chromosome segregation protein n=1 Tax=Phlyctema vagabunda TaxID=108571 RepID=A0ABR4P6A5_9HELO
MSTITTIPARHGIAVALTAGQSIKVSNTHGTQVVDTWAFEVTSFPPSSSASPAYPSRITTQLSMQHTRASLNRTIPRVGDGLYNDRREQVLTLVADTTEGRHDTLIAACDTFRYVELGGGHEHRNCADNLVEGLLALGVTPPQFTPSPFNLFMNIPVHTDTQGSTQGNTTISFEPPTSKKGEYVVLKAERDLVVAFSACPQDILTINCHNPIDAHFEIF